MRTDQLQGGGSSGGGRARGGKTEEGNRGLRTKCLWKAKGEVSATEQRVPFAAIHHKAGSSLIWKR